MKWLLGLGFGILLAGCASHKIKEPFAGIWTCTSSAWIMEVDTAGRYQWSDQTHVGCVPRRQGMMDSLRPFLTWRKDTLWLTMGVVDYPFTRSQRPCIAVGHPKDPLLNFQVFEQTVRGHYAFMPDSLNWEAWVADKEAELRANPADTTLYQILQQGLDTLRDNHGYLEATEAYYQANPEPVEAAVEVPVPAVEIGDFEVASLVADHHMDTEFTTDSHLIRWGRMGSDTGFIMVKAMWLFAQLPLEEGQMREAGRVGAYVHAMQQLPESIYIEAERMAVSRIMDRVMQDLSGMSRVVIDIRFNGGGQDAVAYEILSRFLEAPVVVARQQWFYRDSLTPLQDLHCHAATTPFTGPVYLLISPQTGSAAEALAVASIAAPRIRRVGTATSGALSTALERRLPNGWYLSLSNEVYRDIHGNAYEGQGVPPDLYVPYPMERKAFFAEVLANLQADRMELLSVISALEGIPLDSLR